MNIFDLLQFLNPDWAEQERQRRLRKMKTPDDEYMDGPRGAAGGVAFPIPRMPNDNMRASPVQEYGFLDRMPPVAVEKRFPNRRDI